ncbi:MAG: DNA polymerase III subunit alpha [Candidatus Hydrogenedentes bacterium]|nr:DNA polymerase III subunit alpha [Candidatus Hydrogenedentota bacterium]
MHLHVHSNHSLLEGTATPRQLIARAVEHGMTALALTDSNGMYGAIPFYKAARAAGVNPILGVQLGPAVLLAKDREGYAQLCEIITTWHLVDAASSSRLLTEGKSRKRDGDVASTWPFSFNDEHLFLLSSDRRLLETWKKRGFSPLAAITHYGDSDSYYKAASLVAWAQRHQLRPAAVSPVHFLDPEHYSIHRVLAAIRANATVDTLPPGSTARPDDFFRSPAQMERLYAPWPETLRNLEFVAEECHLELPLGKPLFPEFPLPHGETPFSWLWKKTFEGLKRKYRPLTPQVIDRVRYELDIIHRLGFAPYFLIVWDIVRHARERDIPIVGRGSAANSLVAYALGITRAEPFKYNLYFERFLNLARTDCPDIDLDICWRRRDDVIDYVYRRYGSRGFPPRSGEAAASTDERVAMICTLNTFRARAAIREVAKAHGLTGKQIGAVARLLPEYGARDLQTAVKHIPECRGLDLTGEPLKSIVTISEFIDGFPRHLSIHSGGVVIAPEALTRFTPLQRATKGIIITQYDMGPIEELGLIKMDLLGHRSLTVIADTLASIHENRGVTLDIEAVLQRAGGKDQKDIKDEKNPTAHTPSPAIRNPQSTIHNPLIPYFPFPIPHSSFPISSDPLTAQMLREGLTIGCFQIESPAMRALLRKIHVCDVTTLVQAIALVRPGASGSGMKKHFIDRHHGREPVEYLHPALEKVLGETYGIMVYQEDVLKVAHAVAGMDLTEADALRRAMSKQRSPREMAKSMKGFLDKARDNGVAEITAQAIWELIANFAAYSYCKAHAATYGELAYQCAYLKAHYPAEFLAAVLSNRGGFYSPAVYLEEAKRWGIEIRPPDVTRSHYHYTVEDDAIRVGFVEVRNLNFGSIAAILEAREKAPFDSLLNFLERTRIPAADAEVLFQVGALDCFGMPCDGAAESYRFPLSRPAQLWQLRLFYEPHARQANDNRQQLLKTDETNPIPSIPDYTPKQKTDAQWQTLGILTGTHPLHYYLPSLLERTLVASCDLPRFVGQHVTLAGWLITERRQALRDGSGVMKFLTLEDAQGTYEAVLFSEAYQAYGHLLTTLGPYLVTGQVQIDSDALALIVEHVEDASNQDAHSQTALQM